MRRQAMLDAAKAVFAEKGYGQATLDEVAQRAEFGKGTLYNYFEGGKEAILFAVFDEIYDDLDQLIRDAFEPERIAGRPLRAVVQDFLTSFLSFFLDRQNLFMILIKDAYRMCFSDDRERAAYFLRQRERLVGTLVPTLEAAIERGELKPLPAHAIAHMVLGNANMLQMHLCLEARDQACTDAALTAPRQAAAFLTTMLLDGLLAAPEPLPAPRMN